MVQPDKNIGLMQISRFVTITVRSAVMINITLDDSCAHVQSKPWS